MSGIVVIQSDCTVLIDKSASSSLEVEKRIQRFAEHGRTLGQFEHYYITPLSIWNARSSGITREYILSTLRKNKRYSFPLVVEHLIETWLNRYGQLRLVRISDEHCALIGRTELLHSLKKTLLPLNEHSKDGQIALHFSMAQRGEIKQQLVRDGYNVIDECGFNDGERLEITLLSHSRLSEERFELRDYQRKAIAAFHRDRIGGSGVIVLPCGTGKTLTGIGVMASLQCETLIITSNTISCEQWCAELLEKTTLSANQVGIYAGEHRQVSAITIATYHILAYRSKNQSTFPHMALFNSRNWGLIIYDEVHLLPAPIFRMTASIQATRRLGLTATLIREDGCAPDVYSLVGAKLYDLQWKEAEQEQVIAKVSCIEVQIPFTTKEQSQYERLNKREQYRFASTNQKKRDAINMILDHHPDDQVLIIGQYIDQLNLLANQLKAPMVSGKTSQHERAYLFEQFRQQKIKILVLSKVANLALNLPSASVAIQVSGSYGSRQEEAQRIGRVIRPKLVKNEASFYTLVTAHSLEAFFSINRGRFMQEQGYTYTVVSLEQLAGQRGEYIER